MNYSLHPSRGLANLSTAQLESWVSQAQTLTWGGELPYYIPLLTQANPTDIAIRVERRQGQVWTAGHVTHTFCLMSVIKPFLLLFLLEQVGQQAIFRRVGMEPADTAFNSLEQLDADQGYPRNPMINSGAIALASFLPGHSGAERCEILRQWLNTIAPCQLFLDHTVLQSVQDSGSLQNRKLLYRLEKSGCVTEPEVTLDTYNHLCCLSGTVTDLAALGLLLVTSSQIQLAHRTIVNALMTTCGLYEASARFAVRVGLPTKSGVSGAMLAIVPGEGVIACYSPALDPSGNSIAGLFLIEKLAQTLHLSVFA